MDDDHGFDGSPAPGERQTEHGLRTRVEDRVAWLTLDRPERMNALSRGLIADLVETFDRLETDDDVWVVVLTGSGRRAFSAGVDLKEQRAGDLAGQGFRHPMKGTSRNVFEVVLDFGKPVIAAINGWAMGGGCELALACDLRLAAETAHLGLPESKRGMGATFGAQLLPRLVPAAIAYEMLYTGEPVTAQQAERWGLVNRCVPPEELLEQAAALARVLVERAPLTLRRYRAVVRQGRDLPLSAALRLDSGPDPYSSADRVEGIAAFLENRPPVWRAR
jgi:enoyl-CoA hydratase